MIQALNKEKKLIIRGGGEWRDEEKGGEKQQLTLITGSVLKCLTYGTSFMLRTTCKLDTTGTKFYQESVFCGVAGEGSALQQREILLCVSKLIGRSKQASPK